MADLEIKNEKQFQNSRKSAMRAINKALMEWNEYQSTLDETEKQPEEEEMKEYDKRWAPPTGQRIKINTDAALQDHCGQAGWGIVARNKEGKLVQSWALPQTNCTEPKLEEALAIRKALQVARQEGWQEIEVQSDCQKIIKKLQQEVTEDSTCATVLEDIGRLKKHFKSSTFSFIRRAGNVVGHGKICIKLLLDVIWKGDFLPWLVNAARDDLTEQLL